LRGLKKEVAAAAGAAVATEVEAAAAVATAVEAAAAVVTAVAATGAAVEAVGCHEMTSLYFSTVDNHEIPYCGSLNIV
jgi:hypothetical protein